jgi:cystathionine gamma-synthase
LYGGTYRFFINMCQNRGLTFSFADTLEEIAAAISSRTKAVFIETPSNPMMRVTDIAAVSQITKERCICLVVDNTFLTPYFQKPLLLGADVVLHSGTKYLGGHNDTLAGFLVVKDAELAERLTFIAKTTGACLSPFDSYMILRGIKTLAVRMERQQETAQKIARWLADRDDVAAVYYAGLPNHPGYEISRRQANGFGAMISFSVRHEDMAARILERVNIILYAESLGGVESLITYPMLQTHKDFPEAERLSRGIDARLLRLSVGLESAEDLISDLTQAMGDDV